MVIVNLNVGGRIFTCTRETLLNAGPESLLCLLCNHDSAAEGQDFSYLPVLKDEKGLIFLDRNPQLFEIVLDFLRTDCCPDSLLAQLSERDDDGKLLHRLRAEASYFCIVPLIQLLNCVRISFLQVQYKSVGLEALAYCESETERRRLQAAKVWPSAERNKSSYIKKDKVFCILAELGWRMCAPQPVSINDDYHSLPILMWKYTAESVESEHSAP